MDRNFWNKIKLVAMDFDGVLTDGRVIVDVNGIESVICSHYDGQGIELLRQRGLPVVVISSQRSNYVARRCEKMGIDCIQNTKDKLASLRTYLQEKYPAITLAGVCFIGDDVSDLAVMQAVGIPVTVANAVPAVKRVAQYVAVSGGGNGGVREICDLIIKALS